MSTTWTFGSEAEGLKFTVQASDNGTGGVNFVVTVLYGALNFNALYWGDGDTTAGESAYGTAFTGKDSSLNMNGAQLDGQPVAWDGAYKLSNAGLGSTPPDTYLTADILDGAPEVKTFTIDNLSLSSLDALGVRATSTSTAAGSIKWVNDDGVDDTAPPDHFPDEFEFGISHITLYFDTTDGDVKPKPDGDDLYTVKIDGVPNGADQDLDQWFDDVMAYLKANDPVVGTLADADNNGVPDLLLGVAIKTGGGNDEVASYWHALDGDADNTDPLPPNWVVSGNEVDVSYDYAVLGIV